MTETKHKRSKRRKIIKINNNEDFQKNKSNIGKAKQEVVQKVGAMEEDWSSSLYELNMYLQDKFKAYHWPTNK